MATALTHTTMAARIDKLTFTNAVTAATPTMNPTRGRAPCHRITIETVNKLTTSARPTAANTASQLVSLSGDAPWARKWKNTTADAVSKRNMDRLKVSFKGA